MRINLEGAGVLRTKEGEIHGAQGCVWVSKHKGPFYFNGEAIKAVAIPVLIGHRGAGAGKDRNENTITSVKICEEIDAMAEIDVQLTKDRDVVVFHDLEIEGVKIEDISTKELQEMGVVLLKDLLSETRLDLNIEIKYEQQKISVVEWCEKIVEVVEESRGSRDIVYSSFCREICEEIIRRKYHALFLTEILNEEVIEYASISKCLGVVTVSSEVLAKPSLVSAIKGKFMYILTYGEENKKIETVTIQRMYGVDGFITDEVQILSKFI